MPYFELSDEQVSSLGNDVVEGFKPYTPEDVSGLKENTNKILNEKKALQDQYKNLQSQYESLSNNQQQSGNKANEQLEDVMNKYKTLQSNHENLQKSIKNQKLDIEAAKLAGQGTKDGNRASVLQKMYRERLDIDESGNISVLSSDGKLTVSSTEDLTNEIKGIHEYLFDGSKATGGGATGGSGGATNARQINRAEFSDKTPKEKMEFIKQGGRVINQ